MPLRRPHIWAGGTQSVRDVVLVRWTRADGAVGWGECPTLEGYVTGGTTPAWDALVRVAPALLAGALQPGAAGAWEGPVAGLPVAALGAVADAALDAALRADRRSLLEFLGAEPTPLDRTAVLGGPAESTDARIAAALAAEDTGAAAVKLKVDASTPPEVIAAVVEAHGTVAVDANGTLTQERAAEFDELGLVYLEQPFDPATSWEELAAWQESAVTPVALDEPLGSVGDVASALANHAADIVSIKPARLGGSWAAVTAIDAVMAADAGCFVGGMVELGVHRAGSAAVAAYAATHALALPTDLGPSAHYVDADVCTPVVCDEAGRLIVPNGAGLGVDVDEVVVEQFASSVWDSHG